MSINMRLPADPTDAREARRRIILGLVEERTVRSQQELQALLRRQGIRVHQGTLSRDLRDLGLMKGPGGYILPGGPSGDVPAAPLAPAVRQWLLETIVTGNFMLLKTPPGGAQPLALALDRSGRAELLGTIAGDDTVLAVCRDARSAAGLERLLAGLR